MNTRDIHAFTQDPQQTAEIGGYFEQKDNMSISFFRTTDSRIVPGNTRHSIALPNGGLVWHTHAFHMGWWPSYEDLTRMKDNVHILFTRFGAWIYKPSRSKQRVDKRSWKRMHDYLLNLPEGWNPTEVVKRIQGFASDFKTDYGLELVFVPYFFPHEFPNNNKFSFLV